MSSHEQPSPQDATEPGRGSSAGSARLAWYIAAAVVAALAFAFLLPHVAALFGLGDEGLAALLSTIELGGTLFLRLLKMIVVPLVMFSVAAGVLGVGDVRRLGRPGAAVLLYFPTTTVLAAIVGLTLVNAIRPGTGALSGAAPEAAAEPSPGQPARPEAPGAPGQRPTTLGEAIRQLALTVCTDNLFRAMAEGNLLPLIVFSILFAGVLTTMGRRAEPVARVVTATSEALLKLVMLIMWIAPFGVFCLVAAQFGEAVVDEKSAETFGGLAAYIAVIALGLAIHCLVTLPLVLFLLTRRRPYRFLFQMSEALLTAFSTASSSATLPVSMECAQRRARVSRRSVEFVLPLGSTVNMDGTALYQSVAAVFIAQAAGIPLGPLEQMTIVGTATLASIGTAGVPQSGLIALLIVLSAVGLSGEGLALVLSVDWLVDRLRTTVNVFGDAVGAAVVERRFSSTTLGVG